ncbi:MAG: HAD family phosphatase [Chloroflexi bacterium]|nr:HAD family phosphatase [Chloroflexota bacterium]
MNKAVIFDLGSVLVDYDHESTWTAVAAVSQASFSDLEKLAFQLAEDAGKGIVNGRQLHQILVQQAGTTPDYDEFARAFCRHIYRNEKALAYALALSHQPDLRLGIISNTNAVHVAWLHNLIPEFAHFQSVILSSDVGLLKPDPAIYHLALKQLDAPPQAALFVDDIGENVRGATAVGLHAIHHQNWSQTRPAIENWLGASAE